MRRVRELKDKDPGHVWVHGTKAKKPLFRSDLTPVWSKRNTQYARHVDAFDGICEPDTRDVLSRLIVARQQAPVVAESPATSRQDTNPVKSFRGLHLDPAEMVNCAQTSETLRD